MSGVFLWSPNDFVDAKNCNGLKLSFSDRFSFTLSVSTMKSEKQKMEGINAADLKSKQKQLDDYSKRSVRTLFF